ncbi:protein phosphatase 2A regulatory subunit [Saccharomycopsis crataegensis]|uniref:Protein phosphatase PP2A regulatory subunit B n=1 Tax=Saccharomycopsis crataegensis TaxID=43959 RepID=A0AAV5QU64_9ASCO|nr:protein phosphatase 2A regulatory subunit [Saccharomycopsis crataegensis]
MLQDTADSTDLNQTWKFSQCFGDKGDIENITEADIISTVEFDQTGDYLATGDRGGRVVLFERNKSKKNCEYRFHTEFQSHDAEFDYLKSLEIEEKINKIKWCKRSNSAHFLLSTNDKTIKLWKIYEKTIKIVSENNLNDGFNNGFNGYGNSGLNSYNLSLLNNNLLSGLSNISQLHNNPNYISLNSLHLPRMSLHDTIIAAAPRRIFANAHTYHINSISINSDGETFISADDLRVNLWNLGISDQCFNIVDIKPANMEELTQVITSAAFHPLSCNLFAYSSSKGEIKLADMRENALCDSQAKVFEEYMDSTAHNFFTEITTSISDVKFSNDGRYMVSRDYMTVKIWDLKMENKPIKTINVHEQLRDRLCDAYENDAIFDKFEVVFSGDGKSMMSGSYNNNFMIYPDAVNSNEANETEIVLQADKSAFKAKKVGIPTLRNKNNQPVNGTGNNNSMRRDLDFETVDFKKSILHLSWHPMENSVAIAATNNLYIFSTS